jgi:hypothetical protein
MEFPRRQFLHLAAGAGSLPILSRATWAQVYPTRPVRCIVGYAPVVGPTSLCAWWVSPCQDGSASLL